MKIFFTAKAVEVPATKAVNRPHVIDSPRFPMIKLARFLGGECGRTRSSSGLRSPISGVVGTAEFALYDSRERKILFVTARPIGTRFLFLL